MSTGETVRRVGLLFPGQGVQKEGMGEPWCDTASWSLVAEISEWTGVDVEELLLSTSSDHLRRTDLAQIAVFTTGILAFREWTNTYERQIKIVACAGHSLGEYAALVAAGALTLREGATLVVARGRAMREAAKRLPGTMAVFVGVELVAVKALTAWIAAAGNRVWVANINAPGQVVISGTQAGVAAALALADECKLRTVQIPVGGAFHTPLMAPAAEQLHGALKEVEFAARHLPVVANVDARIYQGNCDWREILVRQITSPVRWQDVMRTLRTQLSCDQFVEFGTGCTLTTIARKCLDKSVELSAVGSPADLNEMSSPAFRSNNHVAVSH